MSNHSYYVGANVNPATNTFRQWMDKTNRLLFDMSSGVVMLAANSTGEVTSGNGFVNGNFGASVVVARDGLRGGNVSNSNTLIVTSALVVSNTLSVANGITGDLTGTASNASALNNQPGSYYTNATNLSSGTVNNARLNSANTTAAGIVQLVDSVSNTSITLAPTANAVKAVHDALTTFSDAAYTNATAFASNADNISSGTVANARLKAANTSQVGVVQLVDSYQNTSVTIAPTAKALNDFFQLYSTSTIPPSNLPAANTTQAGIVQLVDDIANTSVTIAPTANAVKVAYDAAITANTNAATADAHAANATYLTNGTVANARLNSANTSAAGIVQLSDSVASTSIALAATANSVKTAYDLASSASTSATAAYANAVTFAANATNLTNGTVANARLTAANTTTAGIVQLVDSVANTSVTIAPTANAVKVANDNAANATFLSSGTVANARLNAANTTQAGIVQLVDSVANTSTTIAPTANAVKTANDNAANATFLTSGTVNNARLNSASTSAAGIVQLVDSIANTSVSIAPTANAVKQTYDKISVYTINQQNAAYTIALADTSVQTLLCFSNSTANVYTLANTTNQNHPVGASVVVRNQGTANVTIQRQTGVTLRKPGSSSNTDIVILGGGTCTLVHEATNQWFGLGANNS